MTECPSQLMLEEYLFGVASVAVTAHVPTCQRCAGRIAEMRRISGEFRRFVYPATVDGVVGSVERWAWLRSLVERGRRSWAAVPTLAAAATACALLFAAPYAPDRAYAGAKGAPLVLTVFARTVDGAIALEDGSTVHPGTALRFEVHAPEAQPCNLWLVSVDERSQVSRLYPAAGEGGARLTSGPLPGGAILDGEIGPERIFAICSPAAIEFARVERSVRAAAAGGADRVRQARSVPDLPSGAVQTTVLLEKSR